MNLRWIILSASWMALCSATMLPAQENTVELSSEARYRQASSSASADLREALDELAVLREAIADEKPALAKESNQVASDLREARRQADIARITRESAEAEFEKTDREIKSWREERQYLEGLLLDFRKTYEATQNSAKIEAERETLTQTDLPSRIQLLRNTLAQLESSGQIDSISGEALNEDGILVPGQFADAGPLSWFISSDGSTSGLVSTDSSLRPRIVSGTSDPKTIQSLLDGKNASPSFDPTLGTAVALTKSGNSLIDHIKQGGFWIYPILILAAIALFAALAKWFQLLKIREFRPAIVQRVIDSLAGNDSKSALEATTEIRHPAKNILNRGIEILAKNPRASRDDLEESLYEKFLEALPPLNRGLPLVAIASATAPLLGLLGTVTGMIETFRLINIFGTGDAKSLASGISEALVTTEFGLIVAIPALILHALLSRKVQGIKSTMEMTSLAFLNGIETGKKDLNAS